MQFGFAKNQAKGDMFSISPTFRRGHSLKSLQKVMEVPTPSHRNHHPHAQPHQHGEFPKANYAEILESDPDSQATRRANRKLSSEPLAEIKALIESEGDGHQFSLEDGRETKLEYEKLLTIEMATALVGFIGAFMTVLVYDLEFEEKDPELTKILLWAILGSTIVTIFLNVIRYLQKLQFQKARNAISRRATLFSTGDIWKLLLESFVILLQPYPGLQGRKVEDFNEFIDQDYYYHANDFFSLLITFRIFLIIRFVLNNLPYKSPRSQRISDMYGAESDYIYACRCIMKMAPIKAVFIILLCSIAGFGYMVRVCERPLARDIDITMEFNTYWNAMWCVILTMTTVGYGDMYARTMIGRTVSFCMCIWGILLVSLMVVTLTNILTMSAPEEKSLMILRRLELRKGVKKNAAFILTNIARIGLIRKNKMSTEKKNVATREVIKDLKHHLSEFKVASREVKALDDSSGAMEEVNRQIGFLRDDVKTVMEAQEQLQKTVQQFVGASRSAKYVDSRGFPETKLVLRDFEEDVVIKPAK